jgi:dephospho-CoA kinase
MHIGLTGGIACGKSTVADMLVSRGAVLIDADSIAREVVGPGSPLLAEIAAIFGQAVLLDDGTLNRKKLGEIVFADRDARIQLERIMHPSIRASMWERMAMHEAEEPERLVVVDVPLLYESGLEPMFNEIMVVYVPRDVQRSRLILRDGISSEEAERRLGAQMSIEDKKAKADILIDNSGTRDETERQLDDFWDRKRL